MSSWVPYSHLNGVSMYMERGQGVEGAQLLHTVVKAEPVEVFRHLMDVSDGE